MALSIRRRRPAPAAPLIPTPTREGIRASAQRFVLKGRALGQKQGAPKRAWQDEGWENFDEVAELKYSVWYMGNVMAKLRLFAAVRNPGDPEGALIPVTDPQSGVPPDLAAKATAELERLKGELGGQSEIIRALNMNLEVAGEGYIIGFGPREIEVKDDVGNVIRIDVTPESWGVYSISQVTEKGDAYTITKLRDDSKGVTIDDDLDTIIRVWQRHPRWSLEADCAMRGVLSDCEALMLMTNSIKAEAKSRMSGGYLLLPNTLRKGPAHPDPDEGEEAVVDEFTQMLYDGATEAVEDPSAASAVAPTFIFGDKDDLAEIRHLTLARDSDNTVLDKIKAAIERIARGMNLPVEVVMGHQQTTFANALQVKQDTFDDHFEPRCELICDVLTIAYMQPNLIELGVPPEVAETILVGYDPSKMIKQVNPVDSADKGIELDLLSNEAWRRAWGWTEDDAPDPTEQLVRAVLHLRTFDPGITTAVLDLLGINLQIPETLPGASAAPAAIAASGNVDAAIARAIRERAGTPEMAKLEAASKSVILAAARSDGMLLPIAAAKSKRNVGLDLMLLDRELRARLLAAANAALNRALELAGNRLRSKAGKMRSLAKAGKINPLYVGATLGPSLVAAAGIADDDLISDAAWTSLGANFDQWVAAAQERALVLAARVVPVSNTEREIIVLRQASDRAAAWEWMRDQLHKLAHDRLYAPDPAVPDVGEFDPTSRVPAGLIRQALTRAGGATGLTQVTNVKPALRADRSGDVYVAVNNDQPPGGVALGETISTLLDDGGAGVDGYEWVYGPAYRLHPFEEHEILDGETFVNFDDDVLVAGDWIGDYYFPGDHDGCNCDIAPTIIGPGEASGTSDVPEPPAPEPVPLTPEDRLVALTQTPGDPMFPNITPRATQVDLTGLTNTMKELVVDRVAAFAAEYPTAAQSLTSITVDTLRARKYQDTFAFVRSFPSRAGSELHLNRKFFKNGKNLSEILARDSARVLTRDLERAAVTGGPGEVSWMAQGDIASVINHELGHVLDNAYGISARMSADNLFFDGAKATIRPGPVRAWLTETARLELNNISAYAQWNEKEMFAELFSIRQSGGIQAIAARSPELARIWEATFEQFPKLSAAAATNGDKGEPIESEPGPMVPPWLVEELKRDGIWPTDDEED